eukprot:scaffold6.g2859.t1
MAAVAAADGDAKEQYAQWKHLIPYLYDWFANHALPWPSLTCRWGPVLDETANRRRQTLYLSQQTDGSEANQLLAVAADVLRPRVAAAEALQAWSEHAKATCTIIHPGEVNRIRELPQHPHVVVTHTDAPQLYVWNTSTQPARDSGKGARDGRLPSIADLVLDGHRDDAEFALGAATAAPLVASGGRDKKVLVWSLEDHATSLAATAPAAGGAPPPVAGGRRAATLAPRATLAGHAKTVGDVAFLPRSEHELASCADDCAVLFWDLRARGAPAGAIRAAHGRADLHCLDWSPHAPEALVTGAADGSLRLWDRRRLGGPPLLALAHHTGPATCVAWSPHRRGVFASGSEDGLLCVWDTGGAGGGAPAEAEPSAAGGGSGPPAKRAKTPASAAPPQLLFQHCGHRAPVVDFHWNPHDPWTLVSASDEAGEGGGGTLQMWRVSDLIHRPDEEVLGELEQYRRGPGGGDSMAGGVGEFIITGQEAALKRARERPQQRAREGSRLPEDASALGGTAASAGAASGARAADGAEPGPELTSAQPKREQQ